MSFKENLKEELTFQGILVKELAVKTGLNQSSLSNYLRENSSIPAADIAVKIAKALNVSVEYLVEGTEVDSKDTFSTEIRHIALKLSKMSKRDINIVSGLIKTLEENP